MNAVKPLDVIATVAFLLVVISFLPGCAALEKLPPAKNHTMDSCEEYVADYVTNTTVLGGGGLMMCAPGWSQERQALDAKAGSK